MFVVLEGCDNTGKSTLARRLIALAEEKFGWTGEVWHRGVPVRHPLEEYEMDLEKDYKFWDVSSDHHLIVADRWHLGQYVYGGLYREKADNELGSAGLWHVDNRLRSIGAHQIILDVPTELVIERELAGKSEDYQVSKDAGYLKMEDVDKVRARYRDCADMFELDMVDPTNWTDDNLESILVAAEKSHEDAELTRRMRTYIGPILPEILLVGQRRGSVVTQLPPGACFAPYANTSGQWLINTLLEMPQDEHRRIGLINGFEEEMNVVWEQLGRPATIALGRAVEDHLRADLVPHGYVEHPQYMRRYRADERDVYLKSIRQMADTVDIWKEWTS